MAAAFITALNKSSDWFVLDFMRCLLGDDYCSCEGIEASPAGIQAARQWLTDWAASPERDAETMTNTAAEFRRKSLEAMVRQHRWSLDYRSASAAAAETAMQVLSDCQRLPGECHDVQVHWGQVCATEFVQVQVCHRDDPEESMPIFVVKVNVVDRTAEIQLNKDRLDEGRRVSETLWHKRWVLMLNPRTTDTDFTVDVIDVARRLPVAILAPLSDADVDFASGGY